MQRSSSHLFSIAGGKSDIKLHKLLLLLLLAAAAGLQVRAPNDDTGHPTKTYFFPVCTLDKPVSTLDI